MLLGVCLFPFYDLNSLLGFSCLRFELVSKSEESRCELPPHFSNKKLRFSVSKDVRVSDSSFINSQF